MENSNTTNLTKETSLHYIIKTNIDGSLSIDYVENNNGDLSLIQQLGLLEYVKNEITKKLKFGVGVNPIMSQHLTDVNKNCDSSNDKIKLDHIIDENVVGLNIDFFNKSKNWIQCHEFIPVGLDINNLIFQNISVGYGYYVEILSMVNTTITEIKIYMRKNPEHVFRTITHKFVLSDFSSEKVFETLQNKLMDTINGYNIDNKNEFHELIVDENNNIYNIYNPANLVNPAKFENINDEALAINENVKTFTINNLISTNGWKKVKQNIVDYILSLDIFKSHVFSEKTNILFGINNNFGLFLIVDDSFHYPDVNIKKYSIFALNFLLTSITKIDELEFEFDNNNFNLQEFNKNTLEIKNKYVKYINFPLSSGYQDYLIMYNILHKK